MPERDFYVSDPTSYVSCTNEVLVKGSRGLQGQPTTASFASGSQYKFTSWTSLQSAEEDWPKGVLQHQNAIMSAAEVGDVRLIRAVLREPAEKPTLNQLDHLGRNPLHLAVASRASVQALEELLRAGVDPNVKDNVGMTPLSLCVLRSPSVKVIQLLFNYGARLLPRDGPADPGLFLHFVTVCRPSREEREILRILINQGALINDPEAPGRRQALHLAAMSNNCELIRILVDMGADMTSTNHRNETPKEMAISYKCKEAQFCLEELEYRNVFERGATTSNKNNAKVTFNNNRKISKAATSTGATATA